MRSFSQRVSCSGFIFSDSDCDCESGSVWISFLLIKCTTSVINFATTTIAACVCVWVFVCLFADLWQPLTGEKQKQQSDKHERVSPRRKSGKADRKIITTKSGRQTGGGRQSNGTTCPLFYHRSCARDSRYLALLLRFFFCLLAAFIHKNGVVKKEQRQQKKTSLILFIYANLPTRRRCSSCCL